jgi:hypothetical protein
MIRMHQSMEIFKSDIQYINKSVKEDAEKIIIQYKKSYIGVSINIFLGTIYENGLIVNKDYLKALEYFILAAKDDSEGFYNIGLLYEKGLGVEKDSIKMIEYYEKGIEKNNLNCLYKMGNIYICGDYVKKDIEKGVQYLNSSAEKKHISSILCLGEMYENGNKVKKDYEIALSYYKMGIDVNCEKCKSKFEILLEINKENIYEQYCKLIEEQEELKKEIKQVEEQNKKLLSFDFDNEDEIYTDYKNSLQELLEMQFDLPENKEILDFHYEDKSDKEYDAIFKNSLKKYLEIKFQSKENNDSEDEEKTNIEL